MCGTSAARKQSGHIGACLFLTFFRSHWVAGNKIDAALVGDTTSGGIPQAVELLTGVTTTMLRTH